MSKINLSEKLSRILHDLDQGNINVKIAAKQITELNFERKATIKATIEGYLNGLEYYDKRDSLIEKSEFISALNHIDSLLK